MSVKLLAGIFAAALFCGNAAARDVSFDGGSISDLITYTQEQANGMPVPGTVLRVKDGHIIHAKGFIHKDLPNAKWRSFKDLKVSIPNKLDLRPELTPIEDQGWCGSCWAFSLTATHRDGHALGDGDPGRLSQEWLIDNSTWAAGCQGGYFDSAEMFVEHGQALWKDCPYKQGSGKCSMNMPMAAHIKAWYMLGENGKSPTVRDIEAYMTTAHKPVSIGVAASAGSWENYTGGVYTACTAGQLDHMINIVGWDNEGAKFDKDGNLPPGKGIWILRNSWGTSWGENGYMLSKMTDAGGQRCNNVAEEGAYFVY